MSWYDFDDGTPGDPDSTLSGRPSTPPAPPPQPSLPPAPRPARTWTVMSSTVLPGGEQAGLTALVRVACFVGLVVALLQSGLLLRTVNGLAFSLLDLAFPVIIVLCLLLLFLPRLGGVAATLAGAVVQVFATLVGTVLGLAVRTPLAAGGRGPGIPATSLHCRRPDGTLTEVRVAQLCNIPAGSQISVVGPTLMGRRSAWWLRVHDTDQVIVPRGVIPSLVILALTGVALWFIYH